MWDRQRLKEDDYWEQSLRLTIYWIVKRYGKDMNIELRGAMKDTPTDIDINWERFGDDVIVTVLEEK